MAINDTVLRGHWKHLAEMVMSDGLEAYNPFKDFQHYFEEFHSYIQVTKLTWNHGDSEHSSYCFVETIGFFNDLNILGKRMKDELLELARESNTEKPNLKSLELSCEAPGDKLTISTDRGNSNSITYEFMYTDFNQIKVIDNSEDGYKFTIPIHHTMESTDKLLAQFKLTETIHTKDGEYPEETTYTVERASYDDTPIFASEWTPAKLRAIADRMEAIKNMDNKPGDMN